MNLTLNNRDEKIETPKSSITIEELLEIKKFSYKMLMVRVNGKNVRKEEYGSTHVGSGDRVEVIHLISGG